MPGLCLQRRGALPILDPMALTNTQFSALYKISLSIGSGPDLERMASRALSAYRQELGCDVAAVLLNSPSAAAETPAFEALTVVPGNGDTSILYRRAVAKLPVRRHECSAEEFVQQLPFVYGVAAAGEYAVMELPGQGVLILCRTRGRFQADVLRALQPINRNFAGAIAAGINRNKLVNSLPISIVETDDRGRINYFNQQAGQVLQCNRTSAAAELHINDIIVGDIWSQVHDRLKGQSIPAQIISGSEARVVRRDGSRFPALIYVDVLLRDDSTRYYRFVLVDITERLEAENIVSNMNRILEERVEQRTRELNETIDQLKAAQKQLVQSEKMASIGQLAAGVAHEINNPTGFVLSNLGTLKEYARVLKQLALKLEEAAKAPSEKVPQLLQEGRGIAEENELQYIMNDLDALLDETEEGAVRIRDIVRDLRNFSRPEGEGFTEHNLNEIVESALKLVWNKLKYKCSVEKQLGELPPIHCNRNQIEQVLVNLMLNAADAVEADGRIVLRTAQSASGGVLFSIEDNGAGIPEEHLSRLFDPFFTTKEVGKGTGLGLSISHGIIEMHNGTINVDSSPGEGTRFTVELPQVEAKEAAI